MDLEQARNRKKSDQNFMWSKESSPLEIVKYTAIKGRLPL